MLKFGEELQIEAISFKGRISQALCRKMTEDIVKEIGMNCIPGQIIYNYPFEEKGGEGYTLLQPITESMIMWDVWTDHKGGYVFAASCLKFKPEIISDILKKYKLRIIENKQITLHLRKDLRKHVGKV